MSEKLTSGFLSFFLDLPFSAPEADVLSTELQALNLSKFSLSLTRFL